MKNYKMTISLLTEEAETKKAKELARAKADLKVSQPKAAFDKAIEALVRIKDEHDELMSAAEVLKSASEKGA